MNQFYMSPFSLLNNPDFSLESDLQIPIDYIADGGFDVTLEFEVPESTIPITIENLGIFLDVGHPRTSDITAQITSPSGTSRWLTNTSSSNGPCGLSFYFSDDGIDQELLASGIVEPMQSFDVFEGEDPTGTWTLWVVDTQSNFSGFVFGAALDLNSIPCDASISGQAYFDLDSNGEFNLNEPEFPHALIESSSLSTFSTDLNGNYYRCIGEGTGNHSVLNIPTYYSSVPESFDYETEEGDYMNDLNFAITPSGDFNDLMIDMFAPIPDRPGFENLYVVNYENVGTTCIDDVYIEISLDPMLNLLGLNATDYSLSNDLILVEVGTLCPFESGTFSIEHHLDSDVELGTVLSSSIVIQPLAGDETAYDNEYRLLSTVVGSYDPNDKQVSKEFIPESFLENGEYLTYLVRFQNTGTYLAENVVITDTIDSSLNLNSFQLLETSHDMYIEMEGNVLNFKYDDIMLPDSTSDLDGSNGYFRYRIKPIANLQHGDLIENTAYIFFDFNEPIITNTTSTLVDFSSSVNQIAYEARLYPNPSSDVITIGWSHRISVNRLVITDVSGLTVFDQQVNFGSKQSTVDISSLSSGTYFIQLNADVPVKPARFIKM